MHTIPFVSSHYAAGAADGSDTAITITAIAGRIHVIHGIRWSYSAAPTGGALTVVDDAASPNTLFQVDAPAAGYKEIVFDPPREVGQGVGLVITLAGGGGVIRGRLAVDRSTRA
jgi:hypothetical protein